MKKTFKIVSVILCIVMCIVSVSGSDVLTERNDILEFVELTRMGADGSFIFDIHVYMRSDEFTANSDSLTIRASAQVQNLAFGEETFPSTEEDYKFHIALYRTVLGFTSKVGSFEGYSNGLSYSETFDVTSGGKYYFSIEPVGDLTGTGIYLKGYGNVSNVTVN